MKKYLKISLLLATVLALCLGFWSLKNHNQKTSIPNERTVRNFKLTLTINNGVTTKSFDASGYLGKTALETTLSLTNGKVVTKGTGVNAFVTSIDGRAADDSKHEFWELFVNGLSSTMGAGTYIVKDGDQIEWHINTYSIK